MNPLLALVASVRSKYNWHDKFTVRSNHLNYLSPLDFYNGIIRSLNVIERCIVE